MSNPAIFQHLDIIRKVASIFFLLSLTFLDVMLSIEIIAILKKKKQRTLP